MTDTALAVDVRRPGARRTLLALLACALGVFPLMSLLDDTRWLFEAWAAMAIVILPAVLLRLRRAPGALDVWPGVLLLVPWLTWIYLPDHAWHGFIPTGATFDDIRHLMNDLHDTTAHEVAPIHSTVAARLVISALLGLLAALVDLVAVVGRRGALAGVPLLVLFTVSGAVPREPVSWVWFVVAAVGFLILLGLDAPDELRDWGRRVSRAGANRSRLGLTFSAQRIGVIAVAAAVAIPVLVPADARNLLADAFHDKHNNGLGTIGAVGTSGTSISPYIELKGQLDRKNPIPVMDVHISTPDVMPFYVRLNVLDSFTGEGWRPGPDHGISEPVASSTYAPFPPSLSPDTSRFTATIDITNLSGNAPVFNRPASISGLEGGTTWSPQDQLLLGTGVHSGQRITETVDQPNPTTAQLRASVSDLPQPDMSRWLALPPLPAYVTNLVNRLTARAGTSYDRARAVFDYFADPANKFRYTLETKQGDSGSDLVDFLQNRNGFCQQYAGAMGVMLRAAGVPTRIVLGYMHSPPDSSGNFTITTFNAHSWVEAFFPGAGWIPFDPTPTAGLVGGRQTDLPWAQHSYGSDGGIQVPTGQNTIGQGPSVSQSAPPVAGSGGGGGSSDTDLAPFIVALVIVAAIGILLIPATVRWTRRRSRLTAARRGDTDALWAELSDTALDLGYVWSAARTPRQVASWLASDAGDAAPQLTALATAVEHRRFARDMPPGDGPALSEGLRAVTDRLWSRRSGRARLRARLWPASLGWGRRIDSVRGRFRRH